MSKVTQGAVAVMIAVGALVTPAPGAQAFDEGTCNNRRPGAVVAVDRIRIDTHLADGGGADFGDHPHWGGAPQGTAVVCWLNQGGAEIVGRLFVDAPGYQCCEWNRAEAVVSFRSGDGVSRWRQPFSVVDRSSNEAESIEVIGGLRRSTAQLRVMDLDLWYRTPNGGWHHMAGKDYAR